MQLSTSIFQHLSCCLEHMPPQLASPPKIVIDLLEWACRAGNFDQRDRDVASKAAGHGSLGQLLSEQQLACIGIRLLVLTYSPLVQDEGLPAMSVPSRAADAWQLACSYQDGARASHRELLKLLDCSTKTLLYAASTLSLTHAECASAISQTALLFATTVHVLPRSKLSGEQPHLVHCLAFLLPTVLMLWAAERPSAAVNNGSVLHAALAATQCCVWLVQLWESYIEAAAEHLCRLQGQQRRQDKRAQQGAQQSIAGRTGDQQQGVQASSQQQPGEGAASVIAWLASLEPDVLTDPVALAEKLLKRILQELRQGCSSSSSTGGSSSGSAAAANSSGAIANRDMICQALICTVHVMDKILSRAVAAQQADTVTGLYSLVRSTWQAHAGELYRVIEEFVRWRLCAGSLPELSIFSQQCAWDRFLLFHQGSMPSVLLEAVAAAGPAGNRQLWGLAVTLMKAAARGPQGDHVETLRQCVADVLDAVLFDPPQPVQPQQSGTTGGSPGSSSNSSSSSSNDDDTGSNCSGDGAAGPEAAGAVDVRAVVPWLVLAGHCLESLAYQLSQELCVTPELLAEVQQLTPAAMQDLVEGVGDDVSRGQLDQQLRELVQRGLGAKQEVQRGLGAKQEVAGLFYERLVVSNLSLFLLNSTAGQQLSAAGYAVAPLLPELAFAAQLGCLVLPGPVDDELHGEPLQQAGLVMKLQRLGQQLRALPCSWACNNPACSSTSNFAGASELLAKHNYCSRCRCTAYCSQECLVAHFKQHKGACKALAAAVAGIATWRMSCASNRF